MGMEPAHSNEPRPSNRSLTGDNQKCSPYAEQESQELGDDVVARLNSSTGEIENLEVMFFSTRLLRSDLFQLPVTAHLRLAV